MNQDIQTIYFTNSRINTDDHPMDMQPGEILSAVNVRIRNTNDGLTGVVETVDGNVEVEYPLPAGTNKVIGRYHDLDTLSNLYFVWNSEGNHSILRYYSSQLTIGRVAKVVESQSLLFEEFEVITGVSVIDEMLKWTSEKGPSMFDLKMGERDDKQDKHRVYFRDLTTTATSVTYTLTVTSATSTILAYTLGYNPTPEDQAGALADAINSDTQTIVTAEACGKYLEITATSNVNQDIKLSTEETIPPNTFNIVSNHVQPWNFYSDTERRTFHLVQFPPLCAPSPAYLQDTGFGESRLDRIVPQFALRYIDRRFMESTTSPISIIPLDPLQCELLSSNNNCIEIDFTHSDLSDTTILSRLTQVELLVRFTNEGVWKSVQKKNQEEFVLDQKIRFYNDRVYPEVDQVAASTVQTALPIYARALEDVQAEETFRQLLGNTVENYDPACTNVKFKLNYADLPDAEGTGRITGRILIGNVFTLNPAFNLQQPIHQFNGVPVFGGFGNTVRTEKLTGATGEVDQRIPEGGFCVYLLGTDYKVITEQFVFTSNCGAVPTLIPGTNIYDSSQTGTAFNCQNRTHRAAIREGIRDGKVYSVFTLNNIPSGTYILRIANHRCSFGDTLSLGPNYDLSSADRLYEKTSTNLVSLDGLPIHEVRVTVTSGGTVTLDDTYVMDHSDPGIVDDTIDYQGYQFDDEGQAHNPPTLDIRNGLQMELQEVFFQAFDVLNNQVNLGTPPGVTVLNLPNVTRIYQDQRCITDHNGHYFFATNRKAIFTKIRMAVFGVTGIFGSPTGSGWNVTYNLATANFSQILRQPTDTYHTGDLDTSVPLVAGTGDLPVSQEAHFLITENLNSTASFIIRTDIEGTVETSNGTPVPGIQVIYGRSGRVDVTDSNGQFSIAAYGDQETNQNNRNDDVLLQYIGACDLEFGTNPITANVTQFQSGGQYSATVPLNIGVQVVTILGDNQLWFSRPGLYKFRLLYVDDLGRGTLASGTDSMDVTFPHVNQDLSQTDDQFTLTTYKYGRITLDWSLLHEVPIPDRGRFVKYYWVVTPNQSMSYYLTWAASQIQYVSKWDTNNTIIPASYSSGTAREIAIKLDLSLYQDDNSDSQIGYTWVEGDRLILLRDVDGNYFNRVLDLPIKSVRDLNLVIEARDDLPELKQGVLFMIYRPGTLAAEDIYYQITPCYDITDPYGTPVHSTITGTLEGLDAYHRNRLIPVREESTDPLYRYKYPVESSSISDFYPSEDWNQGKAYPQDDTVVQTTYPDAIRVSSNYLPGTKINGFGTWDGLNSRFISRQKGGIQVMKNIGNVLLTVMEYGSVSVYVGKAIFRDIQGQNVVAVADRVLASINELSGDNGTKNPESFCGERGRWLWWDEVNGQFVRYNISNGLYPISEEKREQEFHDLGITYSKIREILGRSPLVWGAFDGKFNEAVWVFEKIEAQGDPSTKTPAENPNPADTPGKIVAWLRKGQLGLWDHDFDWGEFPECIGPVGNEILSWVSGALYIHNRGAANTFYGSKVKSSVKVVTNVSGEYLTRKDFRSVMTSSSNQWSVESIELRRAGRLVDSTLVPDKNWDCNEGDYYADIPSSRDVRGHSVEILFTITPDQTEVLEYVELRESTSYER